MITIFTVVRHGETAANQGNIIQGQTDVPLSEAGENQARILGCHAAAVVRIAGLKRVGSDLKILQSYGLS